MRPRRFPALRKVLQRDDLETLEALLDADEMAAFAPVRDQGCEPPLVVAVRERCSPPLLAALLRRGAFANEAGREGFTAMHWVATGACLIWAHAEDVDDEQPPPYWDPLGSDHPPVPLCEAACAPVHCVLCSVATCEERRLALAACLLSFGAQADAEDFNGLTAADHASKNGRTRLSLLIRNWGDVQAAQWLHRLEDTTTGTPIGWPQPSLSTMPKEVTGLVCKFLVPDELLP